MTEECSGGDGKQPLCVRNKHITSEEEMRDRVILCNWHPRSPGVAAQQPWKVSNQAHTPREGPLSCACVDLFASTDEDEVKPSAK